MPKISQLPNKTTPTLADILPLLDTAAGNTKSASLSEIVSAIVSSIIPSGSIVEYGGSSAPTNWLLCQGQAISRSAYANLFAAIGTTFGIGDGSTTFNLPDFRGNVAAGYKSGDTNFGALGAAAGEATHVLTVGEMPSHGHNLRNGSNGDYSGLSGGTQGGWGYASGTNNAIYRAFVDSTGGGAAHNNVQPSVTVNFIIKI